MNSGAGLRIFQLTPVTSVASTRVQFCPEEFSFRAVRSITIQADITNVGAVVVGDSEVTMSSGIQLGPGDSATIEAPNDSRYNDFDLSDLYLLSNTTSNTVRVIGFRRRL